MSMRRQRDDRSQGNQLDPVTAAFSDRRLEVITAVQLTVAEAAAIVRRSEEIVDGWIRSGLLPVTGKPDSACIAYADLRLAEERDIERGRAERISRLHQRKLEAERIQQKSGNKKRRRRRKAIEKEQAKKQKREMLRRLIDSEPDRPAPMVQDVPGVAHVRVEPDKNPVVHAGKISRLQYLQNLRSPTGAEKAEMLRLKSDIRRFERGRSSDSSA